MVFDVVQGCREHELAGLRAADQAQVLQQGAGGGGVHEQGQRGNACHVEQEARGSLGVLLLLVQEESQHEADSTAQAGPRHDNDLIEGDAVPKVAQDRPHDDQGQETHDIQDEIQQQQPEPVGAADELGVEAPLHDDCPRQHKHDGIGQVLHHFPEFVQGLVFMHGCPAPSSHGQAQGHRRQHAAHVHRSDFSQHERAVGSKDSGGDLRDDVKVQGIQHSDSDPPGRHPQRDAAQGELCEEGHCLPPVTRLPLHGICKDDEEHHGSSIVE